MDVEVTSDKRGSVLHFSGESLCCKTEREIEIAVAQARQKIDAAAVKAKRAILNEIEKGAYG
ncbi:hypothetical protein [Novosphingobium sp.]|uniref:hypothetical protein n=1 Tax=Novosphingobium sp. TaxID=1874826 RepID=UPI0033428B5B